MIKVIIKSKLNMNWLACAESDMNRDRESRAGLIRRVKNACPSSLEALRTNVVMGACRLPNFKHSARKGFGRLERGEDQQ